MGSIFYHFGIITDGDFSGWKILNSHLFLLVFFFSVCLIPLFYYLILFINNIIETSNIKQITLQLTTRRDSLISYLVMIIQIAYFIYVYTTGTATLGHTEPVKVNNPLKYIFTLFNPDALFMIYYLISKKGLTQKSNLIIFLISNIYRGWIAGAMLQIMILFLIRNASYLKIKLHWIILSICFASLLAPSIYYLKYVSRNAETLSIERYSSYYSSQYYLKIMNQIFARFQHIDVNYFMFENIDKIRKAEENKQFVPPYLDNSFRRLLSSNFNYSYNTLNEYTARDILYRKVGGNVQIGILPWLFISGSTTLIYLIFLVFLIFSFSLILKLLRLPYEIRINSILWFSIFYLLHSWFFAFILLFAPALLVLCIYSFPRKIYLAK